MRTDWSRPLPRPLVIPKVMTLKTLADVRELMRHLPAGHRELSTWSHVAEQLKEAAAGADAADVSIALRMVLSMEGVRCHVR
jgi:2-keto-3-deoxy-L-rhamnonate aldolase RhmA